MKKSIVKTDRYGVTYVKNFTVAENGIFLQRFDSNNTCVESIILKY